MYENFKLSLSTHQLRYFFVVILLFSISEGMLIFHMPLLIENELGSLFAVGIMLAISNFSGIFADILFGFVTEITDYRKFLKLSSILSFLMLPILLFGQGWFSILFLVIIWGARFELMFNFGATIYLAKHSSHGEYARMSGVNSLLRFVGFFIGPVLAHWVRAEGNAWLVVFLGIILVIETALLFLVFNNHPGHDYKKKTQYLTLRSDIYILHKHFKMVLPYFLLSVGVSAYEAVFLIFGPIEFTKQFPGFAGILTSVGLLAYIFFTPLLAQIIKYIPVKRLLISSLAGLIVVTFLHTQAVGEVAVGICIFFSFAFTSTMTVVNDASFMKAISRLKTREEDEVVSVRSLGPNLAYVLVAVVGGTGFISSDFDTAVVVGIWMVIISVISFIILRPNEHL